MVIRHNIIKDDWLFGLFKLLLAIAIIIIFGCLFCRTPACH
ncbi:MAG: hypothetical protein PVH77_08475 [Phycisphaerales bacterium]